MRMDAPENTPLSLPEIERRAWALLVNGSQDPKAAFYTGALGTLGPDGPSLRTVVLREVDPQNRLTLCYSDVRAGKVADIRTHPVVSWLFWDEERKIQLRLRGRAAVHTAGPLADRHWQGTSRSNRRSYLSVPPPGSAQLFPTSGLPEGLETREPDEEESASGRPNFAVIVTQIERLEWLWLGRGGHRRAEFNYDGPNLSHAIWLIP